MTTLPFDDEQNILARALYIGQRIDLRAFEATPRLGTTPLTVTAGKKGCAVLFRYGAVVLFNMTSIEEMSFLDQIKPLVIDPPAEIYSEEVTMVAAANTREGIEHGNISVTSFSLERIQLVADVLAKSALMAKYEFNITQSFDRLEPLAATLQREGKTGGKDLELLRHIGDNLNIQVKMVGRAEISDKPELLWDHPKLERLYQVLEHEYELRERHLALERKLDLISRTAETLLSLVHNKRSLRVEWYIVILIVIEIVITLLEHAMS